MPEIYYEIRREKDSPISYMLYHDGDHVSAAMHAVKTGMQIGDRAELWVTSGKAAEPQETRLVEVSWIISGKELHA